MAEAKKRASLLDFLNKGKKQFDDCLKQPPCKSGMAEDMKKAGDRIVYFIAELDKVNKMSPKELKTRESSN